MARRQRGEGSIYRRADGQWVAMLDLGHQSGKRRRKAIYGKTQREVVRKLGQAKRELAERGDIPTADMTVGKWLDYWLDEIAAQRLKPKTLTTYRGYVRKRIQPTIGHHRLDRFGPQHVRELHAAVLAECSTTTALQCHNILSSALKDAMREDRVKRNVATLVHKPAKAPSNRAALTLAQAVSLMAHVADDRLGSRWHTALLLGPRQGECLGLRWQHVDLEGGVADLAWSLQRVPYEHGCKGDCGRKRAHGCPQRQLKIRPGLEHVLLEGNHALLRPKTKTATRVVPIPAPLLASLRRRREAYETERSGYEVDHDLVWPTATGRPIDKRADWVEWLDLLAACGIPRMELHAARHTTATLLLALGVPEHIIMSILGHSDVLTTRRYAHIDLSMQRAALDGLSERLALTQ